MSDADCTPGREPRSVAASYYWMSQIDVVIIMSVPCVACSYVSLFVDCLSVAWLPERSSYIRHWFCFTRFIYTPRTVLYIINSTPVSFLSRSHIRSLSLTVDSHLPEFSGSRTRGSPGQWTRGFATGLAVSPPYFLGVVVPMHMSITQYITTHIHTVKWRHSRPNL